MKFWDVILEFNDKHFPDWRSRSPMYYSNAMAGEVGEICNLTKRIEGGGTNDKAFSKGDLVEECADVLIYMTLLLDSMMIDEDAFQSWFDSKIKILYQRMDGRNSSPEATK